MTYEYILIFWFFTVCLTSLALISTSLLRHKTEHKTLLLHAGQKPLLLPEPNLSLADRFIDRNFDYMNFYNPKYKGIIDWNCQAFYDFSYLRVWLNSHLSKYPDGILPAQAVSFTYNDDHAKHTFNFVDGTTDKNQKYIKQMFTILKTLKRSNKAVKPLDVVKQAEQIVKSTKPRATVKKRITRANKTIVTV